MLGDTILNCYSTGTVSASTYNSFACAGGVAGYIISSSVLNSYSSGVVRAYSPERFYVGSLVGRSYYSKVWNCAALNPSISFVGPINDFGRAVGFNSFNDYYPTLSNNISFNKMLNPDGETIWENIGLDQLDGEDITILSIYADSTLSGRFTAENGWTTENGKLPGLFGRTVDMPMHLSGNSSSVPNISITQTLKVYTKDGILHIGGLIQGKRWSIFDFLGKIIYEDIATDVIQSIPLQINNGIYIVKSEDEIAKFIKN